MKKLLYTLMCCCALSSCTDLEPERYDAINPGFSRKQRRMRKHWLQVEFMLLSVVIIIAVYLTLLPVYRSSVICRRI